MPSLDFIPYKLGVSILNLTPLGDAGLVLNSNFAAVADYLETLLSQTAGLVADLGVMDTALDAKLPLSGGTMAGDLDMGSNSIQQADNIAASSLNVFDVFAGSINVVGSVSANSINASNFIDAGSYRVGGVEGVSGTFTTITSITITNGLITAVTGS